MPRERKNKRERIEGVTVEELQRITNVLEQIGGRHVSWGAASVLEVWIAEARMESERKSASQLLIATWALVIMTLCLVVATAGLIVVAN